MGQMIDDLVSLSVLLLATDSADRDRLRRGAGVAAIPVDLIEADNAIAACAVITRSDVDVILIATGVGAADRGATISAAKGAIGRRPFLFLLASDTDPPRADGAEGADGVLAMPADPEAARVLVEWCDALRQPRSVLIVDDSKTMRSIVRKILGASRFPLDVAEVAAAADAFAKLESATYDLVLLDYAMPQMNGLDALGEIKRRHPQVPVVLISAAGDGAIVSRAEQAGAAAFLKKPFYPADIDATLHRILARSLRRDGAS